MKIILFLSIIVLFSITARSQDPTVRVGSPEINRDYLINRSVFQRLSWIDASGRLTASKTLNCITRIDSANKLLIYLQVRNDGKKDSTVAHWPDLRPVYTATMAGLRMDSYDFRSEKEVRVFNTNNGKVVADSVVALIPGSFDGYLTDYLIGALPLKPGYTANLSTNSGGTYFVRIKQVMTDVLFSPNGQPMPIWVVQVDYNGYDVLYWVDKTTHEMLKSVVTLKDGGVFMKSKI